MFFIRSFVIGSTLGEIDGDEYRIVGRTTDLYNSVGNIVRENAEVNVSYSKIALGAAVNGRKELS